MVSFLNSERLTHFPLSFLSFPLFQLERICAEPPLPLFSSTSCRAAVRTPAPLLLTSVTSALTPVGVDDSYAANTRALARGDCLTVCVLDTHRARRRRLSVCHRLSMQIAIRTYIPEASGTFFIPSRHSAPETPLPSLSPTTVCHRGRRRPLLAGKQPPDSPFFSLALHHCVLLLRHPRPLLPSHLQPPQASPSPPS